MSGIQFTPRQEQAIQGRGNALLVSAAAGSGKTAVLVERVLRYLAEQQGDIRRLIIMTFTEAAAAEMRQKIKKAVDGYLEENGGNDHLLRQSTLIDGAQIGTIHSICRSLITAHFQELKLDPRCRLLDETADTAMVEEQAEQLLEELFGSEDQRVRNLLDCYAAGREDDTLKDLLISGLNFLDKQPLPEDYIRRAVEPYRRTEEGIFACFAEDGLYKYACHQLEELQGRYLFFIDRMKRRSEFADMPLLFDMLEEDQRQLCKLSEVLEKRDYNAFRSALNTFKFGKLNWKSYTKEPLEKETKEILADARDTVKNAFTDFKKKFSCSEAEELERIRQQGDLLETYLQVCMELRERLIQNRRKSGYITFQDMEQLAVQLLVESYDPATDTLQPTPLALQLRQDYDEIIIDEFQDTNRAQDLIFRALSKEEKNLFMVGDIKQSIYRFRGAEPEIFNQKRQQSAEFTAPDLEQKTVLELNANFRSHKGVLTFANRVFESIMSPELGGVCYDEREKLIPGREFSEPEAVRAEIHWLPLEKSEDGEKMEVTLQNARYTAQLIAKMVAERQEILLPDHKNRPVEYKDFAILLRTAAGTAAVYEKELQRLGIPVDNRNEGTLFFELPEVQSILSYLLVLNNPYDDVALVSLLYGDYFRFTVGELAEMRHRHTPLYDDLCIAAETSPKAKAALETIEGYRRLAGTLYVYDLLYRIYQESGVFAAYTAEEGGAEKCANLELLAEDARTFEKEGYRGLYAFVQHIRISSSGVESGARLKAEENSVRIMSMHKSKGLEFPICILGDCKKEINLRDLSNRILFHPRYGAALEYIQPALYLRLRSLSQEALADQMFADCISEEERVLYVALTRPVSKTVVLVNGSEEEMERQVTEAVALGEKMPAWLLKKKKTSFGRWLIALMARSAEGQSLRAQFGLPERNYPSLGAKWIQGSLSDGTAVRRQTGQPEEPVFDRDAFRTRLDWRYPHLSAARLPAKLSVSELKGLREQDEDAEALLEERVRLAEPRFVSHFRPQGNEVGNALHQALQFSNFERLQKDPEEELARLTNEGFILESQRAMIPVEKLRRFTQSDCFKELLSADYYSKEERFLFPMPAAQLFGEEAEGEILIQGVLDCYSVRDGKAVILDYKTDRVTSGEELIERYRVQMDLYEQALRRVKGLTVVRREIYSFSLEKVILL